MKAANPEEIWVYVIDDQEKTEQHNAFIPCYLRYYGNLILLSYYYSSFKMISRYKKDKR